jgi:SH3-like domain-containing protein
MKKLLLATALLVQAAFVMAQEPVKLKSENVNLYRQPSHGAEVVKILGTSDEVVVVRRFDAKWSIVQAGSETGYVHNTHLPKFKKQPVAATVKQ